MTPRGSIVLLLAALTTAPLAAQTWAQLSPATTPGPRRSTGLAFEFANVASVMFGGLGTGNALLGDTWSFDGTNWSQRTPATQPPGRWGHRPVLDTRRNRVVMFGGRSPTLTASANDTWEWDGNDWTQVVTANAPSARAFYSMAFDSRRGVTVLYGNQSGFAPTGGDQTWEYDGNDWTQVTTATNPPGLETPAMAFDEGRGVIVMFGGWNGQTGTMYDTTWEYDGTDWTLRTTPAAPIARYRAACAYDGSRGRVVVYGGFGNASALTDTWEYDGNTWVQISSAGPLLSTESAMTYDPVRQRVFHFGGSGPGGTSGDTWDYTGPFTAIAASWGNGCPTSAGVPTLAPQTTPQLGGTYQLTAGGLPAATALLLVAHGFSNTTSVLGPLPYGMGPLGFGGCTLEVSTDIVLQFVPVAGGTATTSLNIPVSTSYQGFRVFSQALAPDPGAPNGAGGTTNPVHAVVGT